jgi:hypothetical protein
MQPGEKAVMVDQFVRGRRRKQWAAQACEQATQNHPAIWF